MQDKRSNAKSYRKDLRIPLETWGQIKGKDNVSGFIVQAIKEKLEREKGQ
jgi:hypothetical protein